MNSRFNRRPAIVCAALTAALFGWILLAPGCKSDTKTRRARGPSSEVDVSDALFASVVDNLDHLEEFDVNQIMPQICDRLNQWYRQDKPQVDWQMDPLVPQLPEELQELRIMTALDDMRFRLPDAWYLQEAVWLRDISNSARADKFDDVEVAESLFDWTVRNIQLESEVDPDSQMYRHQPFETLLVGRGDALARAWTFMLLARQQGLDVVLLAIADEEGGKPRPWLPALVSGGELYLFDSRLGLPIRTADGQGVATLSQVAADEQWLRALDLDEEHRYPVAAEDLKRVVALVEATPHSLSRRMALIESRLAGEHKMVLVSHPGDLAERVKELPHVSDARLWQRPFEVWRSRTNLSREQIEAAAREMLVFSAVPSLMSGRALSFEGAYDGKEGAKVNLLNARPSDATIESFRLPDRIARNIKREEISHQEAARIVLLRLAKQHASYWLGLICYEQELYPAAVDYFQTRTLEATPNGPWTFGAEYNLGRTYEAMGQPQKAIALYEADRSPQRHGNKLRARWLAQQTARAQSE